MYAYRSHRKEKGLFRGHVHTDRGFGINVELSRRWRSSLIWTVGYGGQEHFADLTFALPRIIFASVTVDTPFKWKRLRPRDGKYGESEAEFGVRAGSGTVLLLLGHDPMGTYWGRRSGRFGTLRQAWLNRELVLYRNEWITGRDKYTTETLDERPVEIVVGRWPSDRYMATQTIKRTTWKNRFRTLRRVGYNWSIENGDGIPTDTKGKWGDRFGETVGFGANADTEASLEELITGSQAALGERLPLLLREWPAGYVPEEFAAGK